MNRGSFHGSWPYSQPPSGYPIEMNQHSPQAKGLVACWMPVAQSGAFPLQDLVSGRFPMTPYNSPTWASDGEMGPSILFDDTSSQYLQSSTVPVIEPPFTLSAWFNSDDAATDNQTIIGIGADGSPLRQYRVYLNIYGIDPVIFEAYDGSTFKANTTAGWTAGQWHHIAAVAKTRSDRAILIDGGGKGVNTSTEAVNNIDRIRIGTRPMGSANFYFSGLISNACIHNRALSDAEVYEQYRNPWGLVLMHRRVWAIAPAAGAVGFPWPGSRHPSKNINLRL